MNNKWFLLIKWVSAAGVLMIYYVLAYAVLRIFLVQDMVEFELDRNGIHFFCGIYCLVFFVFLSFLETFRIGERRILDIIFGFFFSSVCINFIVMLLSLIFTALPAGRIVRLFFVVVILENVLGLIWIFFCHRIYEKYQFCREAIFIYGSREDETEYARVNNVINKFFKINRSLNYTIGLERVTKEIQSSAVVFLGDIPIEIRNSLIKFCMSKRIECYSIPKISDIYIQNATVMQLHDKLLLRYPQLGITGGKYIAKRLTDIIVSLFMLVLFSPVMLVIILAIKLDDGGPVFYYQDRVTLDGKPFRMCKFRSMKKNAEEGGMRMAAKGDVRITRVGKVLRNIHFDELPQLVNVLRGEMSLVGPRPERMEFIREYAEHIPEFPERLKVKGGLTGYAQIYGRYNSEPEDKIKYDLYYIYNYSYWLDLKLLILTIRILFQKENTEGIEETQINAMKQKE